MDFACLLSLRQRPRQLWPLKSPAFLCYFSASDHLVKDADLERKKRASFFCKTVRRRRNFCKPVNPSRQVSSSSEASPPFRLMIFALRSFRNFCHKKVFYLVFSFFLRKTVNNLMEVAERGIKDLEETRKSVRFFFLGEILDNKQKLCLKRGQETEEKSAWVFFRKRRRGCLPNFCLPQP